MVHISDRGVRNLENLADVICACPPRREEGERGGEGHPAGVRMRLLRPPRGGGGAAGNSLSATQTPDCLRRGSKMSNRFVQNGGGRDLYAFSKCKVKRSI